jgi:uncharacterized protein
VRNLSLAAARRIVLAAQGFATPRPGGTVDRRHLRRVLGRIGLLQIDAVNVVARAHYLPVFSRLGVYPRAVLDRMVWSPDRELFEYWGHEASLLRLDTHPLLRWRMARAHHEAWGGMVRLAREQPAYVEAVLAEVRTRGPIRASELPGDREQRGRWWSRSAAKHALEFLFWSGAVTATGRTASFERLYDLTARVLPKAVLDAPTPREDVAQRALLLRAADSLGLGTARDLADYYRLPIRLARARLAELVEDGALMPVRVEGWHQLAYLDPAARRPRQVRARAVLAPFDPLIWERSRVERLFGVQYRIEIYVPASARRYGYYVLPFLFGDRLCARIDLKADRKAGALRVLGSWHEPHVTPTQIAEPLVAELTELARWLGLTRLQVTDRGDLAPVLRRCVSTRQR